jgi:hypothetical protein
MRFVSWYVNADRTLAVGRSERCRTPVLVESNGENQYEVMARFESEWHAERFAELMFTNSKGG